MGFLSKTSGNRARVREFRVRHAHSRLIAALAATTLLVATLFAEYSNQDSTADVSDPASAKGADQLATREVYGLDWLVKNSPFVFVGRLTAKKVERESRGLVVTRNRFDIEDTLIGSSPQRVVTLTTLGGTMDNETVSVSHMPEFVEGQAYIIFTDLARTTYDPITGDERGVFLVVNSEVYTYTGRAIAGIEGGKFRLSAMVLDKYPGAPPREVEETKAPDPSVTGGEVSAKRTVVQTARPMQLKEFSRLVTETKR